MNPVYRCAACGSPRVMVDEQIEGFKYDSAKGFAGFVVLGAAGAAAGISNNSNTIFKCPDCGISLHYPMDQTIKHVVDTYVSDLSARDSLSLGFPSWNSIKQTYKNIETGAADKAESELLSKVEHASISKEQFEEAFKRMKSYLERFYNGYSVEQRPISSDEYSPEHPISLCEYLDFKDAVKTFIQNAGAYLPSPLPTNYFGVNLSLRLPAYLSMYVDIQLTDGFGREYYNTVSEYKTYIESYDNIPLSLAYKFREDNRRLAYLARGDFESDRGRFAQWVSDNPLTVTTYTQVPAWSEYIEEKDNFEFRLPKFIVKDGVLGYWDASFRRTSPIQPAVSHNYIGPIVLYNQYSQYYPDKVAEIESLLKENSDKRDKIKRAEHENWKIEHEVWYLYRKIRENDATIEKLGKKIFGKAKAKTEIEKLNNENNGYELEVTKIKSKKVDISNFEKPLDDKEMLVAILEKYDYLIAWHWTYDNARLNTVGTD